MDPKTTSMTPNDAVIEKPNSLNLSSVSQVTMSPNTSVDKTQPRKKSIKMSTIAKSFSNIL